jgi:riboflavin synthase
MFTGIIENLGKAINFSNGELEVSTPLDLGDCNVGSSISCNGVCLTTTEIEFKNNEYYFKATVGEETQQRTTFSNNLFNKLISINLEKSLKIGDEISGHFVYGHVDRTTELLKVNNLNNSWEFSFKNFQDADKKYIVDKASIAINGISLTITNVSNDSFSISVIPHTYANTNLRFIKENDIVNIEFDYLARFAERFKN